MQNFVQIVPTEQSRSEAFETLQRSLRVCEFKLMIPKLVESCNYDCRETHSLYTTVRRIDRKVKKEIDSESVRPVEAIHRYPHRLNASLLGHLLVMSNCVIVPSHADTIVDCFVRQCGCE